ncbi:hypothetical protein [Nitrososphaera sp.]|uniref:hypothetical protein n=1 Tax=Nitrososphaera sp. TaxID=1971748 RepID=UPI00307F643A
MPADSPYDIHGGARGKLLSIEYAGAVILSGFPGIRGRGLRIRGAGEESNADAKSLSLDR